MSCAEGHLDSLHAGPLLAVARILKQDGATWKSLDVNVVGQVKRQQGQKFVQIQKIIQESNSHGTEGWLSSPVLRG